VSYWEDIKALDLAHLAAYWILNEASGSVAADSSGNGHDGTAYDLTWGQPGIGDLETAASFNGTSSQVIASTVTSFEKTTAGSILVWFRTPDTGVWSDGSARGLVRLWNDSNHYFIIEQSTVNNTLVIKRNMGGTITTIADTLTPDTEWHYLVATWDESANEIKAFLDGAQFGTTQTGIGTSLFISFTAYLGYSSFSSSWSGLMQHVAFWKTALTPATIATLGWIAVTDRTAADLTARTARAFWNVADWQRVTANTATVHTQAEALTETTIAQTSVTEPDITTIPSADDINDLVSNIDALRAASGLGLAALDHAYEAGIAASAPDYTDANAWESTLTQIHTLLPRSAAYYVRCGVGAAGQARHWQSRYRG
jgi:hypothetical protein